MVNKYANYCINISLSYGPELKCQAEICVTSGNQPREARLAQMKRLATQEYSKDLLSVLRRFSSGALRYKACFPRP
jgi:hypothetical protein